MLPLLLINHVMAHFVLLGIMQPLIMWACLHCFIAHCCVTYAFGACSTTIIHVTYFLYFKASVTVASIIVAENYHLSAGYYI